MTGPSAPGVVFDTNVVVAAGFNPRSASARLLEAARQGDLRSLWNDQTRAETEHIVRRIPPLSWSAVEDLFREEDRFTGQTDPEAYPFVRDHADRKFAALAAAAGATLVTSDEHLLEVRDQAHLPILTPGELLARMGREEAGS